MSRHSVVLPPMARIRYCGPAGIPSPRRPSVLVRKVAVFVRPGIVPGVGLKTLTMFGGHT